MNNLMIEWLYFDTVVKLIALRELIVVGCARPRVSCTCIYIEQKSMQCYYYTIIISKAMETMYVEEEYGNNIIANNKINYWLWQGW